MVPCFSACFLFLSVTPYQERSVGLVCSPLCFTWCWTVGSFCGLWRLEVVRRNNTRSLFMVLCSSPCFQILSAAVHWGRSVGPGCFFCALQVVRLWGGSATVGANQLWEQMFDGSLFLLFSVPFGCCSIGAFCLALLWLLFESSNIVVAVFFCAEKFRGNQVIIVYGS